MLPSEPVIVRFSIGCLVLSMFAGVLALAFPEPQAPNAARAWVAGPP